MIIIHKPVEGVSQQALARFAQRARRAAGVPGAVNVVLASSDEMRELNRRFRHKDKPTDVLSFPFIPDVRPGSLTRGRGAKTRATQAEFSGDVLICSDIAAENAQLYGHKPGQEVKILVLHGMLHLAGYDHERDGGKMARQEERLRRELGLSDGLIRRTNAAEGGRATSRRKR